MQIPFLFRLVLAWFLSGLLPFHVLQNPPFPLLHNKYENPQELSLLRMPLTKKKKAKRRETDEKKVSSPVTYDIYMPKRWKPFFPCKGLKCSVLELSVCSGTTKGSAIKLILVIFIYFNFFHSN
ncbi:hypothetical protein SAY86_005541 [Trapa natans]|uniref:Uncharacterized protein n=1 Tax=Trapa natans TaxID=22666 RepID=A0AAN7QVJ9_TRANT|nr:hypothetical protein SAY86_005541 [Trapa natans]